VRLSAEQKKSIVSAAHWYLGQDAGIWLFGSRVDDARRGGDVDLYVETEKECPLLTTLQCKLALEECLDLHVDLLVNDRRLSKPIFTIAKTTGVRL